MGVDEKVEDDAEAVVGMAEFSNFYRLTYAVSLGVEAAPVHDVGGRFRGVPELGVHDVSQHER